MKLNYSIHFHVWNGATFQEFLLKAQTYLKRTFSVIHFETKRYGNHSCLEKRTIEILFATLLDVVSRLPLSPAESFPPGCWLFTLLRNALPAQRPYRKEKRGDIMSKWKIAVSFCVGIGLLLPQNQLGPKPSLSARQRPGRIQTCRVPLGTSFACV